MEAKLILPAVSFVLTVVLKIYVSKGGPILDGLNVKPSGNESQSGMENGLFVSFSVKTGYGGMKG